MVHKYLHILYPFRKIHSCTSSSNAFLINFPITSFPSPSPPWQSLAIAHEWVNNHKHLSISPFKQTPWPCIMPEVLKIMKISIHWCPSMLSQKGFVILHLSASRRYLYSIQNSTSKSNPSLLFLSQPIIGHTPWGCRYSLWVESILTVVETIGIWFDQLLHVTCLWPQDMLEPIYIYVYLIFIW